MKYISRIFAATALVSLLAASWAIALNVKSDEKKQADLMERARGYMEDGVYILAVPLLEEAAGYSAAYTKDAQEALKAAYLKLIDQRGYRRKYVELLERQLSAIDASPGVFLEAANYYLSSSKLAEALSVLAAGLERTGDADILALYEQNRYKFSMGYEAYEEVSAIFEGTIGVKKNGLWGLASFDGKLLFGCGYEKLSTYSEDRAIAKKDGEIFAVDKNGNRLALLKDPVYDFGNYAEGRVALKTSELWRRASGEFELGNASFEQIGTYSGGYAAAMREGLWGLVDLGENWLIPALHDGIATDELGRAYMQGAAFVEFGGGYCLFVGGEQAGEDFYEDARPFGEEGYAAVKKNGLWGYINTAGELCIEYDFEDALSFGGHLAAVKIGELWGYINIYGDVAIEPLFLQAKSFSQGSAPVKTERGWRFITLFEYKKTKGI